ncbi:MAG: hypothetical protein IKT81_07535 [Clostridia bacterium]|nr:hypothetical protein [Clostridia bacterium]MBR4955887.1 hypothetical protein [Clostridia bacterium]
MFGYILANKDALSEAQQTRYRSLYCGLCQALHSRYGTVARLTLSYDMVFLVLILSGMYEPEETESRGRCLIHPLKSRSRVHSRFVDYAADMTVLLSYEKVLDDRRDEGGVGAAAAEKALKSAYAKAAMRHSEKAQTISALLGQLYAAEEQRLGIDAGANLFGDVMAEIFDCGESLWGSRLREFGAALGRFVYVLDAYADFTEDKKRGRYNPLESNADESVLEVLMGEVAQLFEALPIVEDAEIIRNIIYSGVWLRYRAEQKKRGESQ